MSLNPATTAATVQPTGLLGMSAATGKPRPSAPATATRAAAGLHSSPPGAWRSHYLTVLTWAFTLFSSVRVAAYLPTVWAIVASGDSSQHSVWTWCTWLGSNLTMSLWLRERNGGRFCRAGAVSMANAAMCGLTLATIVWFRL